MTDRYKQPPNQDQREFQAFINVMKSENARSYLEIGSLFGCSLWQVARELPVGSRVVAVDNMSHHQGRDAELSLRACVSELQSLGYDAHLIKGDSMQAEMIAAARALGPYDILFIDGDHSPQYVRADWSNYGSMARVVGFHDINWNDTWKSSRGNTPDESRMGAPKVWSQIKQGRRHVEFRYHPPQNYYGIGVLWN